MSLTGRDSSADAWEPPSRDDADVYVVSAAPGPFARLARLWRYRELLLGLVRTELKVKYKNSTLGFLWSMLNPALYLVVFYIVFTVLMGSGIVPFPIFLMSGLLVWNLFSTALGNATGSVVANAGIVKKVAFPREILPIASVGAGLVHFFLQSIVLLIALVAFRYHVAWGYMPLLVPALVTLLLLAAALGVLLSAVNVYLRDTQHLLELVLLAWFWMTAIVYPYQQQVASRGDTLSKLFKLNPVLWIVLTFQRAIYGKVDSVTHRTVLDQTTQKMVRVTDVTHVLPADATQGWYLWHLGIVFAVAFVILVGALKFFGRVEGNFAEEL